jgi:hypothetical protein
MDRTRALYFFLYLLGLVAVIGGISLARGGLYIDRHEGDTLHLIEIVTRMSIGQWPHIDFVTPLGVMSFLPIVAFLWAGFGVGTSILLGQVAFAIVIILPVYWACRSRLDAPVAFGMGGVLMIMALAMVHGEDASNVSMSMHYNRWSWVVAFVATIIAVLPARFRTSQPIDGLILGLAMSFFILTKVTYGVAFAPALIVALILRKEWQAMAMGVGVVALCMALTTAIGGLAFWDAYIGDLLLVSGSDIRPRAGFDWQSLLVSPAFALGNLAMLIAIMACRRGGQSDLGLVLVLLAPAFFYVTYQNYGNDPKWLLLLAVLLISSSRAPALVAVALVSAVLIAPSYLNMAVSPLRHLMLKPAGFTQVFEAPSHADFFSPTDRFWRVQERRTKVFESEAFASLNDLAKHQEAPVFQGESLPVCLQELGLFGTMRAIADDLSKAGLSAGKTVFTADTFGNHWLFGDLEPLKGGAPWYYGALSGFDQADYLLVPTCPANPRAYRSILKDLDAREDLNLTEIRRNELYILFEN